MNTLTTIKDGNTVLKICGTFGSSKTVNVNNFGGVTYIHLRAPATNSGGSQWKTFTMSVDEYRELTRMVNSTSLEDIDNNFRIQVSLAFT